MSLTRPDLPQLSSYKASELNLINLDTIDKLDANEIPLDLPDWFKQKLGMVEIAANRYPDGEYGDLKALLASYGGVAADQVSLGNGSDELIRSLLIACVLGQGSILVFDPTFSMYEILATGLGVPVIKVPRLENFALDRTAAQVAIDSGKVKAVFVVHPNSPTGNLLNEDELIWLRSLSPDVLVVIDEAYFEFANHSLIDQLPNYPNWVILRTFSKAFRLAAYRVGYAIASPELTLALEKIRLPYNLPTISYEAAKLAIMYNQELLAHIPHICQERDRLYKELQNLESSIRVWKSAANFLYLRTNQDQQIKTYLEHQGSLIRQTGGGLRITIGTTEQNHRTLTRLQNYLTSL